MRELEDLYLSNTFNLIPWNYNWLLNLWFRSISSGVIFAYLRKTSFFSVVSGRAWNEIDSFHRAVPSTHDDWINIFYRYFSFHHLGLLILSPSNYFPERRTLKITLNYHRIFLTMVNFKMIWVKCIQMWIRQSDILYMALVDDKGCKEIVSSHILIMKPLICSVYRMIYFQFYIEAIYVSEDDFFWVIKLIHTIFVENNMLIQYLIFKSTG